MSHRTRPRLQIVTATGIILVLGCVSGCATQVPGEDTGALAEGLTVLEAGDGALALAYRAGDEVIFLEALRGQASPYQDEPSMPAFEVDARFLSDDGRTFYSRRGGDGWLDPSWAAALERQSAAPPQRESNEHLFQLAVDAAAVMREQIVAQIGQERAAALAPEIDAVHQFADKAVETYERSVARRLEYIDHQRQVAADGTPLVDGHDGDVAYGTGDGEDQDASFGSNYYYIALHAKCIFLCAGDHSATQLHEWKGYWAHVHDMCNHGDCAGGMGEKGLLQYYEAINDYHPAWTMQTCGTGYDWDSNSGHNCHDDSRRQMNDFVYNSPTGAWEYWCNDDSTNKWKHPSINGDDDEGYNHPNYCQYDWGSAASCPSSWQGTNDGCDCGCVFPDGTFADPDCQP